MTLSSGILESFIGYENCSPKAVDSIQDDFGDRHIDVVAHRIALYRLFQLSS